jgi:hypothetical protein
MVYARFDHDSEPIMKLRALTLTGLFLGIFLAARGFAQLPDQATRIYTLISGSQLTDECPICDRMPIFVPMTGTFRLRFLGQGPLFTRYEIQEVSFHAGTNGGPEYWVSGLGTYQIGGEVGVFQDLFLDVQIDNGFETTSALCANGDRAAKQPWPAIRVTGGQTNGTLTKLYSLALVAVPALQFRAIIPERKTGNILLQWDSNGGQVQVERAGSVDGPYSPISSITKEQTYTDVGALTNRMRFYRLRQY